MPHCFTDPPPVPPLAEGRPRTLHRHGHTRKDPWFWLHEREAREVTDYLLAENAYTAAVMAPLADLQQQLFNEMLARIQEDDISVPVRMGQWLYYSRTCSGQAYAIHARQRMPQYSKEGFAIADHTPAEEILLDENLAAKGKSYYEVGDFEVSSCGRYLAWTEDTRGDRQYRLRVRDLERQRTLRLSRLRVSSLVWAEDGRTLFYTVEDPLTHRSHQLWRHTLGETGDVLLFTERDARFSLSVMKTRSREFLVLTSGSHTTNELRLLPARRPAARWRLLARRRPGIEYELDHHEQRLLLRINDRGPNFRLVECPIDDWNADAWREFMPHDEDVVIEGIDLWQHWMVLSLRIHGRQQLRVTHMASGSTHDVAFGEPCYSVELEDLPEWDTPFLRYAFESLATPESIYDYAPLERRATLVKRDAIPGVDLSHYTCEEVTAIADDGTPLRISLVRHRDTGRVARGGATPLWLEGYGAYGVASDPWFSTTRLSLLDRGWIFAIAHVRGGGEAGQRWHDGGRLANKTNSFSDYIACAQALISQGYTAPRRILANGGSAGGLLIGAVLNMRPDLFGAAILEVPFVDVLTTMLDASLPLTIGEYEEWGDPRKRADYERLLAYSPYDNLATRDYPPTLVEAGLHDSQVMYWEPAKYVAKMRALGSGRYPLLLHTHMEAGHGGASGRYDSLREITRSMAFALAAIPAA